jgi:hypothetical protein
MQMVNTDTLPWWLGGGFKKVFLLVSTVSRQTDST